MSIETLGRGTTGPVRRLVAVLTVMAASMMPMVSPSPAHAVTAGTDGRIAYTATDGSLKAINSDGTEKAQIAPDGTYPTWSPDGLRVAFLRNNREVWIVDGDGTNLIRVTPTSDVVDKAGLAWKPDGTKLAFTTLTKIRLVNPVANGTISDVGPAVNGGTEFYQFLDWSPDGTKLVYGHFNNTTSVRAIETRPATLAGTPVGTVTTSNITKTEPRWSPDGLTVLWSQEGATFSRPADGSGSDTSLLASSDAGATWSPSGKLAFRTAGVSGSISTANANGSSPVTVLDTSDSRQQNPIAWGPRAKCGGLSATLEGTSGDETINGTSGDDVILGWGGSDSINGLGGNDTICGMRGENDRVHGGDGNDRLLGGDGTDDIYGEAGDDDLFGEGSYDFLIGGAGNDDLDGGANSALAIFSDRPEAVTATLPTGSATTPAVMASETDTLKSLDHIEGTNQNDTLTGNSISNLLQGDGGIDTITALDGNDTVIAGPGADIVDGGNGSDTISYADPRSVGVTVVLGTPGSGGSDAGEGGPGLRDSLTSIERVVGSEHADTITGTDDSVEEENLHGSSGNDTLNGGGGPDSLGGGDGHDVLNGGGGLDFLGGDFGHDVLNGGAGIDELSGDDGNDTLDGGPDADYIDGGDGNYDEATDTDLPDADTVTYAQHPAGVTVSLDDTDNDGTFAEGDDVRRTEHITGSPFDDVLIGDELANILNGGGGTDTADYSTHSAGVKVTLDNVPNDGNAAEGTKDDVRTENVVGTTGNDTLTGSNLANRLAGGAGNDALDGGFGPDRLTGGDGTDTVTYATRSIAVIANLSGTAGDGSSNDGVARDTIDTDVESLIGGAGADVLTGNAVANSLLGLGGNDALRGSAGNDAIVGGAGNDTLTGGTGADSMIGSPGTDTASYTDRTTASSGVSVSLDNKPNDGSTADVSAGIRDNVTSSVENIVGGTGNDVLTGSPAANRLTGMKGADKFFGLGGNDVLIANDGIKDLLLNGGTGTDSGTFDAIDPTRISVP